LEVLTEARIGQIEHGNKTGSAQLASRAPTSMAEDRSFIQTYRLR